MQMSHHQAHRYINTLSGNIFACLRLKSLNIYITNKTHLLQQTCRRFITCILKSWQEYLKNYIILVCRQHSHFLKSYQGSYYSWSESTLPQANICNQHQEAGQGIFAQKQISIVMQPYIIAWSGISNLCTFPDHTFLSYSFATVLR